MKKKTTYENNPKVREFDILNYLDSEEALTEYLNLELAEGDPVYIKLALANIARARNISELSRRAGVSRMGIYKALAPHSRAEYGTIQKIVNALDMRLMVVPNSARIAIS